MAFEYGSNSLKIPNPLKKEGLILALGGLTISGLGIIAIITFRNQLLNNESISDLSRIVNLIIALTMISTGVGQLFIGLFRIFRFYIGRGVPGDLAPLDNDEDKNKLDTEFVYGAKNIKQMMTSRTNETFKEPKSFMDRLVYSIFPNLLFLPYPLQYSIQSITYKASYSLMLFFIYFVTLLSSSFGLTQIAGTSYSRWLGILFALILLIIWTPKGSNIKKLDLAMPTQMSSRKFAILTIIGFLIPVISELAIRQGIVLPNAPLNPLPYLLLITVFAIITTISSLLLANFRSDNFEPKTEVSEYRSHWQYNLHPKELFTNFNLQMAKERYKEIPNRIYQELKPKLSMEGSMDKGSFEGSTIQELQPEYLAPSVTKAYKLLRLLSTIYGELLIVLSFVIIYLTTLYGAPIQSIEAAIIKFFIPAVLYSFGTLSLNLGHICWAEISFSSTLIHFFGEGTYTESKLSTGMAIMDSTRSENTLVRTSFAPIILATNINSVTFVGTGNKNLSGPRYILNMEKNDILLNSLVDGLMQFINDNGVIAHTISLKDQAAIKDINELNRLSHENYPELSTSSQELQALASKNQIPLETDK